LKPVEDAIQNDSERNPPETAREKEIDGLRAFAVLAVLGFHADISKHFSGGFIGVDIFFVISGYVITLSLRRQIKKNKFDLFKFIERRATRLLPALISVLFFSNLAISYLFDYEFRKNSATLSIAGLASFSNIFLWLQSNYFDESSRMKPYLHTWSLSVEWQYYLTWAIITELISNMISNYYMQIGIILSLQLASLLSAELFLQKNPAAVFYNIPFRYFEFLVGSLAAWIVHENINSNTARQDQNNNWSNRNPNLKNNLLSATSVAVLIFYVGFFKDSYRFPGISALPVCICSILIIRCSKGTYVGNILTHHIVLFIGDISYSVYLVHWPLFVIYEYKYGAGYGLPTKILLTSLSIISGFLLHRGIEKPFMQLKANSRWWQNIAIISAIFVLILQAYLMHVQYVDIYGNRTWVDDAVKNLDEMTGPRARQCRAAGNPICHARMARKMSSFMECNPNPYRKLKVVLLGDSHAGDFYFPLKKMFPEVSIIQMTGGGCNFYNDFHQPVHRHCEEIEKRFKENIEGSTENIIGAILINWWRPEAPNRKYPRLFNKINFFKSKGIEVFVFGVRPMLSNYISRVISQEAMTIDKFSIDMAREKMKKYQRNNMVDDEKWLRRKIEKQNVHYISQFNILCNTTKFSALKNCSYPVLLQDKNGIHILYYDNHHLTARGNKFVLHRALPIIKSALKNKNIILKIK